ncbi:hypothetical protein [Janthinobacterium sp. B9-8]|uniref:hypothetical protein n=1 Tax=Janthinobacterium sp. B9-8 TaxID=1236179 RepID=UPI00061D0A89|nr:hypothetical protein [Janthinobacterium sp. B9-8]AMC36399.1 hypothetical protein VN23_18295 [Janthinobacterium sp. B9-8]
MSQPDWYEWAQNERAIGEYFLAENPLWFKQVCQLLFDCDPMMIHLVANPEGYAPEVGSILRILPQCQSAQDVQDVLYNVFTQWFSPEFAGGLSQYADTAQKLWALWLNQQLDD